MSLSAGHTSRSFLFLRTPILRFCDWKPRFESRVPRWLCSATFGSTSDKKVAVNGNGNGHYLGNADFFAQVNLDKAGHCRTDPAKLKSLEESEDAILIPWHQHKCLLTDQSTPTPASNGYTENSVHSLTAEKKAPSVAPVLLPLKKYINFLDSRIGTIFLGVNAECGSPVFAGCIDGQLCDSLAEELQGEWRDLRGQGPKLSKADAGMLAEAHGLMVWHMNHLKCSKTGNSTSPTQGGHARVPQSDNEQRPRTVFPRIDPAAICLVSAGGYCLLGRKPRWVPGRYSILSGFTEIGETLEMAVHREVLEESSVKVNMSSIRYLGSQPWPFPQSLMIGFMADANVGGMSISELRQCIPYTYSGNVKPDGTGFDRLTGAARQAALNSGIMPEEVEEYLGQPIPPAVPQPNEMDDVRWFHYDFLNQVVNKKQPAGPGKSNLLVPGKYAIARQIIDTWLHNQSLASPSWNGDAVKDTMIDSGVFKYVLLRVSESNGERSKLVVAGARRAGYHMNIFQEVKSDCSTLGLNVEVLGGGRMEHYPEKGCLSIYGYSAGFGPAVHEVAAAICQRWLPFYDPNLISVSYSGY